MKCYFVVLLLLGPSLFAQKVQLPPSSRHVLENGLTVILVEYRKVPVVHFRIVVRGGSAEDPAGAEGTASIATSLMREGTTSRTSVQIAQQIDFIGGSLSVSAGQDYCAARCEVLKKDLETGLDLLADVVLRPTFPQEELERERKQRLANLNGVKEDPSSIASIAFTKEVYGDHPYGKQTFGTAASLGAMSRTQLVQFHERMFVAQNASLSIVGDFNSDEMLEKIRTVFGGWKGGTRNNATLSFPEKRTGRSVLLVDKPDVTQTQIRCGNVGIDIRNPDFFPLSVANAVFGSGFTSRLMEELRVKRSLTYGASSGFPASLYGGSYNISTFTKNSTITETMDVIVEELRKYRATGASAEECQKAQNYVAGSFARALQTPEALALRMTDIEFYGFPANHLETYIERLKSVTTEDVRRVAQQYFLLDDLVIVMVTPAQQTQDRVGQYGAVRVTSLDETIR